MKKFVRLIGVLFVFISFVISTTPVRADSLLTTVTTGANPFGFASIGSKMYVINVGQNTVTAIDTANNFSTTNISVGSSPHSIIALGTKIYTANMVSNNVSVIDTANGNAVTTVTVGNGPGYLAAIGSKVYVTNSTDGTVTIIDTLNGYSTTTIAVGVQPNDLIAIGSKLYIAHSGGSSTIYVMDTANGNATSSIAAKSYQYLAASGTTLYSPDNSTTVNIVDTAHGNAISSVTVDAHAQAVAALGSKVYTLGPNTSTLSTIDTVNGNAVTSISIGSTPSHVAALGTKVYFTTVSSGGTLSMLDTANGNAVTNFPSVGSPQQIGFLSPYIFVANNTAGHVSVYTQQYALTYTAGTNGSITGSASQTVSVGFDGTAVTAVPDAGYHFVNWSDNSTANPRMDTAVIADKSVTANFAADPRNSSSGGAVSVDELARILVPGPATDAYLASRGYASGPAHPVVVTATTTISTISADLGPGSTGPEVKKLQQYLNSHGFVITSSGPGSPGQETERFGTHTFSAVKAFQKAHGLPVTGTVGSQTRALVK